jgi:hypothetical protein
LVVVGVVVVAGVVVALLELLWPCAGPLSPLSEPVVVVCCELPSVVVVCDDPSVVLVDPGEALPVEDG